MNSLIQKNIIFTLLITTSFSLTHETKNTHDCSCIAQRFQNAQNDYYGRYPKKGFTEFLEIEKCKKHPSADKTTLALNAYSIATAYHYGLGVTCDQLNAHKRFNDFFTQYSCDPTVNQNFTIKWALANTNFFIGEYARYGIGEPKNPKKAVTLYQAVVDNPDADSNIRAWSQARLGDALRTGNGIKKNQKESIKRFQSIIDHQENIEDKSVVGWAQFWIADDLQYGRSTQQNITKAKKIFQRISKTYDTIDQWLTTEAQKRLDDISYAKKTNRSCQ